MAITFKIDKPLRERRRINRLLDFLKRDNLTGEQMQRIGRHLQKSGKRALTPLVRKLWCEKNDTNLYRYTCMLEFFDSSAWVDQLIKITLKRDDLEENAKLALLDVLYEGGVDVTAPPFAVMTGYAATTMQGFVDDCLSAGESGFVRFIDNFIDVANEIREELLQSVSGNGSDAAVAILEILLSFDKIEIKKMAITALGHIRNGYSLTVLQSAESEFDGELLVLVRKNIRRLSFVGIRTPLERTQVFQKPLPLHQIYVGPVDFYGSRTIWFSWHIDETAFAAMLILTSENNGLMNTICYRIKNEKEYSGIVNDMLVSEMLALVEFDYAMPILRDALSRNRDLGLYLPPDFYVDMRFFPADSIKPEAYIPRFNLKYLENIIDKIPAYVASSNELLDESGFEGWILTDIALYDVAERYIKLEGDVSTDLFENEVIQCCKNFIVPRRAELIKLLLLTADFLQYTECGENAVQQTLATALSLVGGFVEDHLHPFVRRLIIDSIDAARQSLIDGFDPRKEEVFYDDEWDG